MKMRYLALRSSRAGHGVVARLASRRTFSIYLPSATVDRIPVAKTIAKAARLSSGELLFNISVCSRLARRVDVAACRSYRLVPLPPPICRLGMFN